MKRKTKETIETFEQNGSLMNYIFHGNKKTNRTNIECEQKKESSMSFFNLTCFQPFHYTVPSK